MRDYIIGFIFVIALSLLFYSIGAVSTNKNKSDGYKLMIGYLIYSFFIGAFGMIVQLFNIPWKIYLYIVILTLIGTTLYVVYQIKFREKKIFDNGIKEYFKNNYFLFVVTILLMIVFLFSYNALWFNNHLDDGYYLTKIADLPYVSNPYTFNYSTGFPGQFTFERIINTPARGIGKKTLENIQLVALNHQISLYDALTLHSDEIRLSNKSKKEVRILVEAIEKARRSTLPLHEMFEQLMIDVGYIDMLKNDLEDNRIDNIHELQRSIYDFQVSHEDAPTLENYLQDISLYTDNDSIDQGQYVSLMSIHMAKGLEFDYVFVLGLSEGIFPSFRSLAEDGDDGLEEERRLAYVAFTRARKQLFLTDSEGFSFVTDSPKISSRFIDEVGNEGIIHSGSKPRFKTTDYVPKQTVSKAELIGDNKVDDWKVGDLVNHDIFGKGVVVKVNKNILDIAFELPAGLKSLMANHKALKKLTN